MIKNIFWNSEENRLRMLWRLIGQLLILVPVFLILQIALGAASFALSSAGGGLDPGALSDPASVQSLINQNPILNMIAMISTGLALTISIWIAGRLLDRRKFADFGLAIDRAWWRDLGFGLGLGALLMGLIFLVEWAAGWITITGTLVARQADVSFLTALLPPLILFLAVGFYEELFSRGYQLTNLAEGLSGSTLGPRGAILAATLISSAVFGALHAGNPNASFLSSFNIAVAGIFLAAGFLLTGQLAIPIGLHITWNFFQGNVFGFPVSGTRFHSATFIAVEQGGPDLWTGAAFGPEAGLLGLGAMILGTLLTILWVRFHQGESSLQLSISQPPSPVQSTKDAVEADMPPEGSA